MERRDLLKFMAMAVGGSVAVPHSAFARLAEGIDPAQLDFFTPAEREQVAALAEAIIPKTDTPGAIEAGVPEWIEVILKDCYEPKDQQVFREGLPALFAAAEQETGKPFATLTPDEQVAFLTAYDGKTKAAAKAAGRPVSKTFLQQFKELTKLCYCSSEVGSTTAFEFHLVPGRWEPAMPLEPGMKVFTP